MFFMRAPHVVLPSLTLSLRPRDPCAQALLLFVPPHSMLRVLHSSVPAIPGSGVMLCV